MKLSDVIERIFNESTGKDSQDISNRPCDSSIQDSDGITNIGKAIL